MSFPRNPLEGDQSSRKSFKLSRLFSAMAIVITASLAACGGGSSGGGSPTATISGQVVDKVLSNAKVSIFSSGLSGSQLGTATTDSNGNYTITFTPPSGSTPLFLTAVSSGNTLSSYIGSANTFSGTVKPTIAPDLNITQATTAALAVVQNQNISLSSLTPTTYAQQIVSLQNAIYQLAAVVQDIVDQTDSGCSLSGGLTPSNLSSSLGSSPIASTTNLITSLNSKLSSCSTTTINTLASQIPSNQTIAPQLTSTSASNSSTTSVSAGAYTGNLTPIMTYNNGCTGEGPSGTSFSATITVGSSGSIKFSTSSDGSASGTLTGDNFTMTGTDQQGESLSISGAVSPLSSGSVSGGSGISVNGSWQIACSGGTYGGTYNVPSLLTSGATLTSTTSTIPNGTYTLTVYPDCTSGNCGSNTPFSATATINGNTFSFSGGSNGSGSGTLTGNTFAMTITSFPGSTCTSQSISITGAISSSGNGNLTVNGTFQQTSTNCGATSGTFTMST